MCSLLSGNNRGSENTGGPNAKKLAFLGDSHIQYFDLVFDVRCLSSRCGS